MRNDFYTIYKARLIALSISYCVLSIFGRVVLQNDEGDTFLVFLSFMLGTINAWGAFKAEAKKT